MTYDLEIKKDDTFPTFKFQIARRSDGEPIDVQGETVQFWIRKPSAGSGGVFAQGGGSITVLDSNGNCVYNWDAADTDEAGVVEAECRFTKDGKNGTVPPNRFWKIRVYDH